MINFLCVTCGKEMGGVVSISENEITSSIQVSFESKCTGNNDLCSFTSFINLGVIQIDLKFILPA